MIVLIVDKDCVPVVEAESEPPIAVYLYRPMSRQFSSQRVEVPPGKIHAQRIACPIQGKQLHGELLDMRRLNPSLRSRLKELLQPTIKKLKELKKQGMEALDWEFLIARAADRWKEFLAVLIERAPDDTRLADLAAQLGYAPKALPPPVMDPAIAQIVPFSEANAEPLTFTPTATNDNFPFQAGSISKPPVPSTGND